MVGVFSSMVDEMRNVCVRMATSAPLSPFFYTRVPSCPYKKNSSFVTCSQFLSGLASIRLSNAKMLKIGVEVKVLTRMLCSTYCIIGVDLSIIFLVI